MFSKAKNDAGYMKFSWKVDLPISGDLIYRKGEYSIDFKASSLDLVAERVGQSGNGSLLIATLQIELGVEHGDLLYPWGYFPHMRWKSGALKVPRFRPGSVRLTKSQETLIAGVSVNVPNSENWPIVWDETQGWICVGNAGSSCDAIAIEYAHCSGVVLEGDELVSIWLQPAIEI